MILRRLFPEDVSGKSVLHVGCGEGELCRFALRKGAARAVGVDVDPSRIERASSKSRPTGGEAAFHVMNVEEEVPNETFDVVVCGILNHVTDPAAVLRKLGAITREVLLLELESPASTAARRFIRRSRFGRFRGRGLHKLPVFVVGRGEWTTEQPDTNFYVSPAAIENLLMSQRRRFGEVQIVRTERDDRYGVVARTLRIGRLIFVAGPASAGKTTLIRTLKDGTAPPKLRRHLELGDPEVWEFSVTNAHVVPRARIDALVVHYDFNRPWRHGSSSFERDQSLDLLEAAEELTLVTVCADLSVLLSRQRERIRERRTTIEQLNRRRVRSLIWTTWRQARLLLRHLLRTIAGRGRWAELPIALATARRSAAGRKIVRFEQQIESHRSSLAFYQRPEDLARRYSAWFEYCSRLVPKAHWIVDTSAAELTVRPIEKWDRAAVSF